MTFRYFLTLALSCTLLSSALFAQEIPIGTWRDHLPYSNAVSVTQNGNLVYCAAESAIFIYDLEDYSIVHLNLVNGLSDIGITKIKHIPANNRIVVAYQNGNVDVILEDKSIFNLAFIKNANTIGDKTINHIEVVNEFAYLSTGVGIVVLNTNKLEFSDTYNYSSTGNIVTNAVTFDTINIYAATDDGVYFADKNSLNLSDFNTWNKITALGNLNYNGVVFFANQLFVSYDDIALQADTLFRFDAGVWKKFPANATGKNITNISVSNNRFLEIANGSLYVYDNNLNQVEILENISPQNKYDISESVIALNNINYLIADKNYGLVKAIDSLTNEVIVPNGPSSTGSLNMDLKKDELWVVSGGYVQFFTENLVNHKSKGTWLNMNKTIQDGNGNTLFDMVAVIINPKKNDNVYVGSWDGGLIEYNNNQVTAIYNAQNSSLDSTFFGSTRVGALAYDSDNNLWISSSGQKLSAILPNKDWKSFSFPGFIVGGTPTSMLVDNNDVKWVSLQDKTSIIVFSENETMDNSSDDLVKLLTAEINDIPGVKLNDIAKDLDGEIWIGTDEGIAVFYNPSEVFDIDIKAERIFIQQDGQTQILFETEVITSIAIDGANRKWIGTQTSGVFLMSDDGTEEIEHFTVGNSPLFSNNILDIVIDPKTGEIFFGTDRGLISYKGTATEADDDFNNVVVYPNPVREDFNGTIAIKGLIEDTDVRITDVSGNIVYQTTSLGGQAIWDGNDMNGNRVQTGVYLIFNGSQNGEKKYAAKILFIH